MHVIHNAAAVSLREWHWALEALASVQEAMARLSYLAYYLCD
jgi:hypothetical protein